MSEPDLSVPAQSPAESSRRNVEADVDTLVRTNESGDWSRKDNRAGGRPDASVNREKRSDYILRSSEFYTGKPRGGLSGVRRKAALAKTDFEIELNFLRGESDAGLWIAPP